MSIEELEDETPRDLHLLELFLHPSRTLQSFVEYGTAWLFTRDKFSLIGIFPTLLLLGVIGGLAITGSFTSEETITKNIADLVEQEFRRSDAESEGIDEDAQQNMIIKPDASLSPKHITPYAEMLLKKLALGEGSDARWRYLVALQLGQRQRLGQARQIMRKLAPKGGHGFAPAYAWLAWDAVTRNRVKDHAGKLELISDLQNATAWSGTGPAMIGMLAELLESEGRVGDAIKALETNAKTDAGLSVKLFGLLQKHGRKQHLDSISEQATSLVKSRVASPSATEQDFNNYASLCVMQYDVNQALLVTAQGLTKFPDSKSLIRARSEAYRIKYLRSVKITESGFQCDLNALNEAMRADPTNTSVAEEVAKLLAAGASASPELTRALEQQLADGHASGLTHLLLSEKAFADGNPQAAVPHLEAALRRSPDAVAVLNNLALTLARLSSDNLPRARELIDRAIAMADPNAELYDTQGEVRMLARDFVGAVESFENAINVDGKRTDIRARLVKAYEKSGLHEMAKVEQAKINQMSPKS